MRGFVPLKLGGAWLAIPAEHVQEILGEKPWVPVPYSSARIPGVMGWRGRAIVVFDVASMIDPTSTLSRGSRRPRTIVLEAERCTLALPVDLVREVQEGDVKPPHATRMDHSLGEVEVLGSVAPILDVPALVRDLLGNHELPG
jgi:chemotaxis signal transduction protein